MQSINKSTLLLSSRKDVGDIHIMSYVSCKFRYFKIGMSETKENTVFLLFNVSDNT